MTLFQPSPFRVRLTGDFYDAAGTAKFAEFGLDVLQSHAHVGFSHFPQHQPVIQSSQVGDAHGVVVLTPRVTAETLASSPNLLVVARVGVGYDSVDVDACTAAGVLVTITPGAVDRPVAEATVGWMIALSHHFLVKDRLVRTGRWDDRTRYMGCELRDRTLGIIGFGGIGRAVVELLRGFGMRTPLIFDPFLTAEGAAQLGVRAVPLDELMSQADFVSVHCPLTPQTRGLIGARELALMKPDAYLLNTARGGIVSEDALHEVLQARRIAGAALDCFDREPVTEPSRFRDLDNVLLAPHSIAWTHELFRDMGRAACQCVVDVSLGKRPKGVVNRQLIENPRFLEKWSRLIGATTPAQLTL